MSFSDNRRDAEDLRDAVSWFEDQRLSASSVEQLLRRVLSIADRLDPPKVVPIRGDWGWDRREGWSVRVARPQRDHSKEGA